MLLGGGDLAGEDIKACCASIYESEPVGWLLDGQLHPGGEALTRRTAQLAGIMAAKRTSELIPLCHPLPLSAVDVSLAVGAAEVEITAAAETIAQTGVEMEALVAASVAALTVYDMAKAVDKEMVISRVRLVEKTKELV